MRALIVWVLAMAAVPPMVACGGSLSWEPHHPWFQRPSVVVVDHGASDAVSPLEVPFRVTVNDDTTPDALFPSTLTTPVSGFCTVQGAGEVYVVLSTATTTTGGDGPYCMDTTTCTNGPSIPLAGRAYAMSTSGDVTLSCRAVDAGVGYSSTSAAAGGGGGDLSSACLLAGGSQCTMAGEVRALTGASGGLRFGSSGPRISSSGSSVDANASVTTTAAFSSSRASQSVTAPGFTTGSGVDLAIAPGTGSRGLVISSSTASSTDNGVRVIGTAAASTGRTSVFIDTSVSGSAADRYVLRAASAGGDVLRVSGNGQVSTFGDIVGNSDAAKTTISDVDGVAVDSSSDVTISAGDDVDISVVDSVRVSANAVTVAAVTEAATVSTSTDGTTTSHYWRVPRIVSATNDSPEGLPSCDSTTEGAVVYVRSDASPTFGVGNFCGCVQLDATPIFSWVPIWTDAAVSTTCTDH